MKPLVGPALVVVGTVLGFVAASTTTVTQAQLLGSGWLCANATQLGDKDGGIPGAKKIADGLRRIYPDVPKGTTLVIPYSPRQNTVESAVCVMK